MPHQCTTCGRTFPDGSKEMLSGCSSCGGNKFQFKPSIDEDQTGDERAQQTSQQSTAVDATSRSDRSRTQSGTATSTEPAGQSGGSDTDGPSPHSDHAESGVAGTVANAADTVRDWVGSEDSTAGDESEEWFGSKPRSDGRDSGTTPGEDSAQATPSEDTAQADARSGVVDPDAIPDSTTEIDEAMPATTVTFDETDPAPETDATPTNTETDATPAEMDTASTETGEHEPAQSEQPGDDESPDLDMLREELNQQFESIRIIAPGQYELNLMELYDREEYIISLLEDGRYAIEVPEAWRDGVE